MKILEFIATFVLLLATCRSDDEAKSDDGVLVLTSSNFDKTIEANENILVEFYAPWCGHCKALEPQYAEAAKKLAKTNPEIKLAKVDATIETTLAERFQIKGFPTMKFFKGGNAIEFTGGRQSDEIVSWLLKKTGPPAKTLSSVDEVKEFISEPKVAVIGFFKDLESDLAKNYLQVADSVESIAFAISSEDAVLSEYKAEEGKIIMFKKFDDGEVVYTGSEDPNEIKTFVSTQSLPLAVEFDHQTAQKIFGGDIKTHLLFFVSKKEGHYEKHIDPIKHLAKEIRDKLLFVLINTDEADNQRILEYFGILEDEVPSMRLIKLEDEMIKYKPDSNDLSAEHVQAFITAFFDGKLKEHLLSQPLPEDWDKNPVKVLVATNFDEVVFNTEKDVLVEFYAPWCGHCKELEPIYNKLGEKFQDKDDILIAKLDATANELEHTKIGSFPTLKLYKKGDNKVIDYNGERTLEGLTKFLESGGGDGAAVPEDGGDEEDDDLPRKDEL